MFIQQRKKTLNVGPLSQDYCYQPDQQDSFLHTFVVDVGEEKPRTVISGLVKHIPLEKMQVRYVLFL